MIHMLCRWTLALFILASIGCSLPPEKPVTIDELMATRVFRIYKIKESPEDILRALNRDGEVIVEGERPVRNKMSPVYVKILMTVDGFEITDYER